MENGSINTTRNYAANMIQVSLLSNYPGFLQIPEYFCVRAEYLYCLVTIDYEREAQHQALNLLYIWCYPHDSIEKLFVQSPL